MTEAASNSTGITLIHFSDLHLYVSNTHWSFADWSSKRLSGWLNLFCLGRENQFARAQKVALCFRREIQARQPHICVFSGDSSALGFSQEITRAAELLGVAGQERPAGLAVPGNHDYYTKAAAASGAFETQFAAWLQGERVDAETYPFARKVGPFWLVAVNSCTGNRLFWDSSGSVGTKQLERLERLFQRLGPGPRILTTHYPVCRSDGRPEPHFRCLRDLDKLLDVCLRAGICLWLHGHRHTPYWLRASAHLPFPIICAGSLGQRGHWSYGEYLIQPRWLQGIRRMYSPSVDGFVEDERFELTL